MNQPYFKLFIGPMFAEKTTNLISEYNKLVKSGTTCIAIKPKIDTRYSSDSIVTHNGLSIKCLTSDTLENLDIPQGVEVIAVDEIQFFLDFIPFLKRELESGKTVIATGLSSTFQMKPWIVVSDAIALADEVVYLRAICKSCKRKASFSRKICDDDSPVVIGAEDKFEANCRLCHSIQ